MFPQYSNSVTEVCMCHFVMLSVVNSSFTLPVNVFTLSTSPALSLSTLPTDLTCFYVCSVTSTHPKDNLDIFINQTYYFTHASIVSCCLSYPWGSGCQISFQNFLFPLTYATFRFDINFKAAKKIISNMRKEQHSIGYLFLDFPK